eukprot:6490497-Prymnesium_polylepis.2
MRESAHDVAGGYTADEQVEDAPRVAHAVAIHTLVQLVRCAVLGIHRDSDVVVRLARVLGKIMQSPKAVPALVPEKCSVSPLDKMESSFSGSVPCSKVSSPASPCSTPGNCRPQSCSRGATSCAGLPACSTRCLPTAACRRPPAYFICPKARGARCATRRLVAAGRMGHSCACGPAPHPVVHRLSAAARSVLARLRCCQSGPDRSKQSPRSSLEHAYAASSAAD